MIQLRKALLFLQKDQSVFVRLFRYGVVGVFTSLLYVIFVMICVNIIGLTNEISSAISYVATIPINYSAHRRLTFRSYNRIISELPRYLLLHGCNIAVTISGMFSATELFGYPYWVGAFTAVILVPISSFLVMNFWIFINRSPKS